MSILFDAHEDPTNNDQQGKRTRRAQHDDRLSSTSQISNNHDDILIFGYHCKLFRDDEAAQGVNDGKFLIPWMGNKDLLIDRYDCRGHLYRLEEFDFYDLGDFPSLSPEQIDIENVCDEERYMDLNKDMIEEEILQEEEDKRGSALYDPFEYTYEDSSDGKQMSEITPSTTEASTVPSTEPSTVNNSKFDEEMYHQFCQYYGYDPTDENLRAYFQSQSEIQGSYQYDYDRPPPPSEPPPPDVVSAQPVHISAPPITISKAPNLEPEYEKFKPPEGIVFPENMEMPETFKMQQIIDKTAAFISKQSAQMEIVLKTKQSGNPQFAFLEFNNYLNPYYKFILEKIKAGEYDYIEEKKDGDEGTTNETNEEETAKNIKKSSISDEENNEESDDGEEHELHPLLQAHRRPLNNQGTSSPAKTKKDDSIINHVPQTKMTGKVEDLAKVYMQFKYSDNSQNNDIETKTKEEKETEDLPILPPPPLPPPPNLAVANGEEEVNTEPVTSHSISIDASMEKLLHHLHQYPIDTSMPPPSHDLILPPPRPPPVLQGSGPSTPSRPLPPQQAMFGRGLIPPPLPPPSLRPPHFPSLRPPTNMRIPPPNMRPPLSMGPLPNIPGGFANLTAHLLNRPQLPPHLNQQHQYPHEMYHLRSAVPPPPPPPLPSLLPPGVDALPTSYSDSGTIYDTMGPPPLIPLSNHATGAPSEVTNTLLSAPGEQDTELPHSSSDSLLPPGEEADVIDKQPVAPPDPPLIPPPPIPPPPLPDAEASEMSVDNNHSDVAADEKNEVAKALPMQHTEKDRLHADSNDSDNDKVREGKKRKRKLDSVKTSSHSGNRSPLSNPNSAPGSPSANVLPTKIVTPGKDLQSVIDRLALYVVKNGDEFEDGIKEKKDPRFDFLNSSSIYHPYYLSRKQSAVEFEEENKRKEEDRKKNLKVKFDLKSKVKPVTVSKKKKASTTASVFNQVDEDEPFDGTITEGFQPNVDPEKEVKRKLRKQIEEKEKLLRQLHEQALLQQKIAEVNKQASAKPLLNLSPNQHTLKDAVKEKDWKVCSSSNKDTGELSAKQDERKKRAASFVGKLKKPTVTGEDAGSSADGTPSDILRKRHFKDGGTSSSTQNAADRAAYERKKAAFYQAINNAFKGGTT